MIINKKGEKFYFEGVEYVIGGDVIGTEESVYSGLLGNIYEFVHTKIKKQIIRPPIFTVHLKLP
mgnify:CR=1 FL=1